MSAHDQCYRPGKFNCGFDEMLATLYAEGGDSGQGSVDSITGWFDELDLIPESEGHLIEHYGGRWAILRESSQGFFWGEFFETEQARDERLDELEAAWLKWATEGVL